LVSLQTSSELAAFVAGIGYYRPDPWKQRTQSAKEQSARPELQRHVTKSADADYSDPG
jgi:hypothetical protein